MVNITLLGVTTAAISNSTRMVYITLCYKYDTLTGLSQNPLIKVFKMEDIIAAENALALTNASQVFCAAWNNEHKHIPAEFAVCVFFILNLMSGLSKLGPEEKNEAPGFFAVFDRLIPICRKYPNMTSNATYIECMKDIGVASGYCDVFTSDTIFENCVLLLRQQDNDNFSNMWTLFETACARQNGSDDDICFSFLNVRNKAFNVTLYTPDELSTVFHFYLLPTFVTASWIINGLMITVFIKRMPRNQSNYFMIGIGVVDSISFTLPLFVVVYFLYFEMYHDFTEYSLCVVTILSLEAFPAVLHGISMWFKVALSAHRLMVIQSPVKLSGTNHLNRRIISFLIFLPIICFLMFVPAVVALLHQPGVQIASMFDNTRSIYTMVPHRNVVYNDVEQITFWCRIVLLQLLPCIVMTYLEIKLIIEIRKMIQIRKTIFKSAEKTQELINMTYLTLGIAGAFLLAEIPNCISILIHSISYLTIDVASNTVLTVILNIVTLISCQLNGVICCCMSKEFRTHLVSLFSAKKGDFIN